MLGKPHGILPPMEATGLPQGSVLNLGCGRKRRPGAINVDRMPATDPDLVHDLNVRPWPFADNQFREVYALDVLEHLDDLVMTMEEVHRICRDGARVEIAVPHFSSSNAFTDPTHRRFFSRFTFDYFDVSHPLGFYSSAQFRVVHSNLIFASGLVNRVAARLANRYPRAYEARWTWIFPAWFISVELAVIKPQKGASHLSGESASHRGQAGAAGDRGQQAGTAGGAQ